ncbi:hypothetical protein MMC22_010245 [Lobaria immixta]|nr:hypothetical protein [Lobaria immixta]
MNWSGGALSRSRNSNTLRSAAQKRNFAKARGNLLRARQSFADFDFSTLEHARIEIDKQASQRQSPARSPSQPLRSPSHGMPSSLEKQIKSRTSGWAPSFPSSSSKQNHIHGPDILEGDVNISAEARLEAQKQKLLAMRDWCGLQSTRPVKISFPDMADVDLIGKRRPVLSANGESSSRQGAKRRRVEADVVKTLKKRKIHLDEDSDTSCRKNKSNLPRRKNSCAERISMDMEHNGQYSNSDELLLDTRAAAKCSGASFNSDENLFDLENAIPASRPSSPKYTSLSPQVKSTIRPSPLKNEMNEADLACDENDGSFDAESDLSQKHSLQSREGRLNSRFLPESPSRQTDDSPRSTRGSSHVQQQADHSNAEPHQSGEPSARSTRSIRDRKCPEECVTLAPAIYDSRSSNAYIGIKPSETNLHLTSGSKPGMPTGFLMEDTPPLRRGKLSPLASATLSDMKDLKRQSIGQTPTTATSPKLGVKMAGKSEVLPTEIVVEDSMAWAKPEGRTARREKSLSPDTVWRNFVLGDSDDESTDEKYELISQSSPTPGCRQEARVNREPPWTDALPSSMSAEPSRSLHPASPMSTDELAPSPARLPPPEPKIIFKKPRRFHGEGSGACGPRIRLGRHRWSAITDQASSRDEDDVIDD